MIRRRAWYLVAGYALLVIVLVAGLLVARQRVLSPTDRAAEQAAWDAWRTDAAQQDGSTGPVKRTPPKSEQPPLIVLMNDYFAAVVIGLLAPITALYVFLAWTVRGLLRERQEA